ncbi:aldo/keto reductase [Lichenihabitans psoromatis]|uniref:aldo/keto reductase n=1 Tax=Lichenihabitans psoromatis TaxID=2528642 RepID=UPI0010383EA8|nr:aldo/keto reductase [Lichenihabitans psoromatis]
MNKRQLGGSGLNVAPWCFGGNVFGWTADEAMSFRLLDAFIDAGFDFIDTADVYSRWAPGNKGGESETIIGKWLAERRNRDKVVIATKVGMEMGPGKDNLSKAYIVEAVEASLKRLQTDVIDLYQSHRDDAKTPPEETIAAYADLIKSGKVRAIGASNFSTERLAASLDLSEHDGLPRYETLQPEYNLYNRSAFETSLQPLCVARGVGVIPYYSLASGFLTGKYRSEADFGKSPRGGNMAKYLDARGLRILAALDQVADAHHATQSEVALAWLMAQPSIVAPIASATTVEQVVSLAKSADLSLSTGDIEILDQASTS